MYKRQHTRIAGQETGLLQGGAILLVDAQQGAGDAVTQGAGLAGDAAAGDGGHHVELADGVGQHQGLTGDQLQGLQAEIIVDVTAVDGDGAGAALIQANAGDGGLATAGALLILSLALVHTLLPPD